MSIFVKAHKRAGTIVKSYTRGSRSKVSKAASLLGLKKVQLVKSHAYQRLKAFEDYGGPMPGFTVGSYWHNKHRLQRLQAAMKKAGFPGNR